MKKSEVLFVFARIINDAVMIYAALMLAYGLRMRWFSLFDLPVPTSLFPFPAFAFFAAKIAFLLVLIFGLDGRYKFQADEKLWDEVGHILRTFSAGMALVLVLFFFQKFTFFSRFIFGVAWISGLTFILAGRIGLRQIRRKCYEAGFGRIRILVLGTGDVARAALQFLNQSARFEVVGILAERHDAGKIFEHHPILGTFGEFESVLKKMQLDEVLVAAENSTEKITDRLVRLAHIHHVRFRFLPDELGLDLAAVEVSTLGEFPLVTLHRTKLGGWGYVIKSGLDIFVAAATLAILSPLLGFLAWKIRKSDKNAPIFYGSERVGYNGKKFLCWKFRTMVPNADEKKKELLKKNEREGGVLFKIKNDPRVTRLGKILRKWSLDELPQLWNVVRGEMSLIGPRPHLPEEVKEYGHDDLRVLSVKPGMTGFAQINGRSSLSFEEEMKYELFYLKNWSLWLDALIFLKTIAMVLKRKNVS